jgi:hypothetical protein
MTTEPDRVDLLAFPFSVPLLGTVATYALPPQAQETWTDLMGRFRERTGSVGNLPTAALTNVLRSSCRTRVNIYPTVKDEPPQMLVAARGLDTADLCDAIRIWEQVLLGAEDSSIRFSYNSRLADIISTVAPVQTQLSDEVRRIGAQPDAPGWVFDVSSWHAAEQLSARSWPIDGMQITFRMDTNGNLLVWDNNLLWSHSWPRYPPRFATAQIRLAMKTLPWMNDPVLMLKPSVFWIANRLRNARTAWLAPNDPAAPLLVLKLNGRYGQMAVDPYTRTALAIWSRLRGEQPLETSDVEENGQPGRLRPVIPVPVRYPVGRGLGMHTLREFAAHAADVLGVPSLTASRVAGHRFPKRPGREKGRDTELLDRETLSTTIRASGTARLRIVVLYQYPHTRRRIQNLLAYHFEDAGFATKQIPDNTETALSSDCVTAVFCEARDLLKHGEHGQRKFLLAGYSALIPQDGTRIAALCETEYDEREWAERRIKARIDKTAADPDKADAKHPVNKLLAKDGVASQFIATKKPSEKSSGTAIATMDDLTAAVSGDYAGHGAIGDLLRTAGLVHARLGDALAFGADGITNPHVYVGIHLRQQKKNKNKLSCTLAALAPGGDQWGAWGYCWEPHPVTGKTGWQPYADANVTYRAGNLLASARHTMWDNGIPQLIDVALSQLESRFPGIPYVVFISGEASRTIWPGLANKHLERLPGPDGLIDGKQPLPGCAGRRPAAVVRVTPSNSGEVPRPVPHIVRSSGSTVRTTKALLQLDQLGGDRVFLLANVPRQYDGDGRHRRVGAQHSRWTATQDEQPLNWYQHTATEILVCGATEGPRKYGVVAARLCDHAISWDGRTQYPAPLHLAMQMDRDHPEYRRTVFMEEQSAALSEEEQGDEATFTT